MSNPRREACRSMHPCNTGGSPVAAAACAEGDPTHVRNDGAMREGGAQARRHDEGPHGETRVELRCGEGVYSGLGLSRGDLSRREGGRNAIAGASSRTGETADGKTSA